MFQKFKVDLFQKNRYVQLAQRIVTAVVPPVWILSLNVWADTGIWIDTETWND